MSKSANKPMQSSKQVPMFEAQTSWFHVFKEMVDCGDVAKLGPHATTVYMVIKAYTNWKVGVSWPGVDLIVEKSGISKSQVLRSLKLLEELGYLSKTRKGRKNFYTLREKVVLYEDDESSGDKRPSAVATWDYLPSTIHQAGAELKNFILTGKKDGLNIIHIEQLNLNIQQNFDGGNVQENPHYDFSKVKDKNLKSIFESIEEKRKRGKASEPSPE